MALRRQGGRDLGSWRRTPGDCGRLCGQLLLVYLDGWVALGRSVLLVLEEVGNGTHCGRWGEANRKEPNR